MMKLPEDFISQIKTVLPDKSEAFFRAMEQPAEVSVRFNEKKHRETSLKNRVPWCDSGYYLGSRVQFTFDPLFHAGIYYVQDASSMILSYVAKKLCGKPLKYLDLCAAPGGKSTAVINALPEGSLVVSNEIIGSRAQVLRENIIKWGASGCVVTNNDSESIGKLNGFFDIIAADVPCSGEGMFRKDEEAVAQWSLGLVKQCAARQREVIGNIWNALRPGGYLIYSTCTYNRDENEEMVEYIISNYGATSVNLDLPAEWNVRKGIDTVHDCYRFMPDCTRGEGLFLCVLKKNDIDGPVKRVLRNPEKNKKTQCPQIVSGKLKDWIISSDKYDFRIKDNEISAVLKLHADDVAVLTDKLKVIYAGIGLASIKGNDVIPLHALAVSNSINLKSWQSVDVAYRDAIAFLRGESLVLGELAKGYILICYDGVPLGFVKNLGNRANNMYPKEWRIRSTYAPADAPSLYK